MAIVLKNKNFAKSTLASGITSGATSLTVATGEGVRFPATGSFRAVIWGASYSSPTNDTTREIVTVTGVAGDVLTIVRAAESTTAKAWSTSDQIAHVITGGKIDELETEINLKLNISDATSAANVRDINRGLIVKNNVTNPNYQVDVDSDEIELQNATNQSYKAISVNLTADITVNGINGYPRIVKTGTVSCAGTTVSGSGTLFTTEFAVGDVIWFNTDAVGRRITAIATDISLTVESSLTASSQAIANGGEAPNTWYYSWVIYNGTTVASLLSTSATAPTMPSGYTYKAYAEIIYNDGLSNFMDVINNDIILCDATSGNIVIDLMPLSGNFGKKLRFKKSDASANTVTINPNGSETINGLTNYVLINLNQEIDIIAYTDDWKCRSGTLITEGSIDWANAGGISQGQLNDSELSTTSIGWTTVGTGKIYIPANSNILEYLLEMQVAGGTGDSHGRLEIATGGDTFSLSDTSYTWSGLLTLDISSISGWQTVNIQLDANVGSRTVYIKGVYYRIR